MENCIIASISSLYTILGVAVGAILSGKIAAKNAREQERRNNLREIYTKVTVDIEKVRVEYDLVFNSEYVNLLDAHFALIKLYASKNVEDEFKKFGSYVHAHYYKFSKYHQENCPDEYDKMDPYFMEDFDAKIAGYKKENCPTLKSLDEYIKPLQAAMRKDLGSDTEK